MVYQPPKDKTVYNLDTAWDIAQARLRAVDIARQCLNSGALRQSDGSIQVSYLNQSCNIIPTTGEVLPSSLSLREKILILHYFTRATGAPPAGKQITFRDLPGGLVYYPTFMKRTIQPLVNAFGKDAPRLTEAGKTLGARPGEIGDAALIIDIFPRVPVHFILWAGDEELTPDLNLLLDANILAYLESEDVTIACEIITWRLINTLKKV